MPDELELHKIYKQNSAKFQMETLQRNMGQEQPFSKKSTTIEIQNLINKKSNSYLYFQNLDIKTLTKQLKQRGGIQRSKLLNLIDVSEHILKFQPNVLRVQSPVVIIGDIHGQFYDLLNIFQQNGYPDKRKFLFLGDYVDRGLFCIEVLVLLLVLKLKYPKNVHLLRGNHEGKVMTMNFNFRIQCQRKYGIQIYERFLQLFCKFPLCGIIDQTYFTVHGGISPQITLIKQIQKINRFVEIQNKGVVCDLVWSDPSDNAIIQWQPNSMRGCSYYYSKIQAKRFLKDNKIKMIIRGHEVQIEGFNYQKTNTDDKLTLTIFSAPNYCDTYKNKGAIALISNNKISIHRFGQVSHPFVLPNYMDCFEFSMPGVCQLVGKLLLYLLKNRRKSRKSSMIEDKLLEQLDALKRIQVINHIIQQKIFQNQQVLQQVSQTVQSLELTQDLAKSYEISYQLFFQKKNNDAQQMYPHENTLAMLRQRKKTKKLTLASSHQALTQQQFQQKQNCYESYESNDHNLLIKNQVFGPKLHMSNNISKKMFFQEQANMEEDFK